MNIIQEMPLKKYLSLPLTNTNKYEINSIKYQSIYAWNMFVNKFHNLDISSLSKYQCKNQIIKLKIIS